MRVARLVLGRRLLPAAAAALVLCVFDRAAQGGDELEHRHLVYVTARAAGFTESEAETLSAASWSVDQNAATDAMPTPQEKAALRGGVLPMNDRMGIQTPDELSRLVSKVGYFARGYALHALGDPASRIALERAYWNDLESKVARGADRTQVLVQGGMLFHFLVDARVHPYMPGLGPLVGHALLGHTPDYALDPKDPRYVAAASDLYRGMRRLLLTTHPERAAGLEQREAAFGIDFSKEAQSGLHSFSTKILGALADAYASEGRWTKASRSLPQLSLMIKGLPTVEARARLADAFDRSFAKVGESPLAVPEFKVIRYEDGGDGTFAFRRLGDAAPSGRILNPVAEVVTGRSAEMAAAHTDVVGYAQILVRSAPAVAAAPGMQALTLAQDGTVRLVRSIEEGLEKRKLGGVNLDVVVSVLDLLDEPVLREGRAPGMVSAPLMVSLKRVLAAAAGGWPTDPVARSLGGLTRIRGYVVDPESKDVVLVGSAEPGVPPIGLDVLVVAVRSVWKNNETPAVSLDPTPGNLGGPQVARVLGIPADSRMARVMLDADYVMKRVLMGADAAGEVAGFTSMAAVLARRAESDPGGNRFWFYPVRLGGNDVRVSTRGDVVLFDAQLEVLTEAMAFSDEAITGTGRTSPAAEEAVRSFTEHLDEIAARTSYRGQRSIAALKGVLDAVTLCRLWQLFGGKPALLEDLSKLAAPPLPAKEIPRSYEGVTHNGLVGGAYLQRLVSRRHLDSYDDGQIRRLRADARTLAASGALARESEERRLTLAKPAAAEPMGAELAFQAALRAMADGRPEQAVESLTRAITLDPDMFEALLLRGVAQWRMGKNAAARADVDAALRLSPEDSWAQTVSLRLGLESDERLDLERYDERLRRRARDALSLRANRLDSASDFEGAIRAITLALRCNGDLDNGAAFSLLVRRGRSNELAKRFGDAERDYHEARRMSRLPWFEGARDLPDLWLGLGRVELAREQYDVVMSSESSFAAAELYPDARVRLEAAHSWAAAKDVVLRARRRARINAGLPISRAFSQLEASTLRGLVRELTAAAGDESERDGSSAREWLEKIERLKRELAERARRIERAELHD